MIWDREVGGSNPLAPTKLPRKMTTRAEWFCSLWRYLCRSSLQEDFMSSIDDAKELIRDSKNKLELALPE